MENTKDFEVIEDVRQSEEYSNYIQSIGWKVISFQLSGISCKIFLRNFLGLKIAKIQRTKGELPWKEIFKVLKKERVFSVRYEPADTHPLSPPNLGGERDFGFKYSSWPLLGTKTLRVNLKPNTKTIFNSFKKDARYALRKFQIPNSKFLFNEFDIFYNIWKSEVRRKGLWIPSNKEYKNLIKSFGKKIFCLTYENLGGAVILVHKKTAFYYYSACRPEGKKLQLPYLIIWECMKKAKIMGCTVWDFEGIYDQRWPNKGWRGFSHFKKSFGGKEIEFPGSFQKWLWPI